jgi:hypothetical protein
VRNELRFKITRIIGRLAEKITIQCRSETKLTYQIIFRKKEERKPEKPVANYTKKGLMLNPR